MGTRSLTFVYENENKTGKLMCLYRQMDGYPSGHGKDLADFLVGRVVVNGYNSNTPQKASNGMGCLAASLVAELKDDIGGFYLFPTNTRKAGQDYEYHIYPNTEGGVNVIVKCHKKTVFKGDTDQFLLFCEEE